MNWFHAQQIASLSLWVCYACCQLRYARLACGAERLSSKAVSAPLLMSATARLSACIPVLFLLQTESNQWFWPGMLLQAIGWLMTLLACVQLGSSLSLVPTIRQLKTKGLYSQLRHPVYLGELLWTAGWVLSFPSLLNAGIWLLFASSLLLRIHDEETFWQQSEPTYKVYCQRVRYRLLPKLY
jgi:protein-S-isoprenylcysteine O-methyltransferase Ste14